MQTNLNDFASSATNLIISFVPYSQTTVCKIKALFQSCNRTYIFSLHYLKEPAKGPHITHIIDVTSTSMRIFWEELGNDDANGVITGYQVCYKASENPSGIDCNLKKTVYNGGTRDVVLDGLNEATTYNVAVKAATRVGFGNLGSTRSVKTNGTRKYFSPGMLRKAYCKVLPSFLKKQTILLILTWFSLLKTT